MTISPIWGRVPSKRTITKFGLRGRVADVIICFKFYRNRFRGFRAVRGQKWGSSIDFDRRPYNRSALPCCLWSAGLTHIPGIVTRPLPKSYDVCGRALMIAPSGFRTYFRILHCSDPKSLQYICQYSTDKLRSSSTFWKYHQPSSSHRQRSRAALL